jgi:hypothetical protein
MIGADRNTYPEIAPAFFKLINVCLSGCHLNPLRRAVQTDVESVPSRSATPKDGRAFGFAHPTTTYFVN